jgi:hypothetical protein
MKKKIQTNEHYFYSAMSVLCFLFVVLGFGNFYGSHLIATEKIPAVIHVHAAIFFIWILLFVTQAVLIFKKKISLHMKTGQAALVVAAAMLLSGFFTARFAAQTGHTGIPGLQFPASEGFLLLNLASLLLFIILVTTGWFFRNTPETHKRLMLMASAAGLAPPAISRLPGISGVTPAIAGFVMIFILAGPVYDLIVYRKVHKAYLFSLPLVAFILPPVVAQLSSTELWIKVAHYLT